MTETNIDEALKPTITLVGRNRTTVVELEWPVDVDGRIIDTIVIRRMSVGQVTAFVEQVESDTNVRLVRFPMFFEPSGEKISNDVFDALDDDDAYRLVEAANDFLPRRFRTNPEPDTPRERGAPTAPS